MTNDPSADDSAVADPDAFEDWLDRAAESKGVSRQELMNQMLSSYWILDELTGLVEEADSGEPPEHRSPGPTEAAAAPEEQTGSEDDFQPAEQSSPSKTSSAGPNDASANGPSAEESIREIHSAIRELLENQSADARRQSGSDTPESPSPFDGSVVSVVSDLQRQVGKFESKLDDVESRQDKQFDRLSNELQLALDRVNELEHDRERFVEQNALDALTGDVHELNDRIDRLRAANEELDSRIDRKFDSIEALFRRVLDAIDDLDSDIDAATESYRSELEPIQRREAEQKRLEELKSTALRRDIRRGVCDNCEQGIDISLLESPECPSCAAGFTGIDDSGWNPFRSPRLETETGPIDGT